MELVKILLAILIVIAVFMGNYLLANGQRAKNSKGERKDAG